MPDAAASFSSRLAGVRERIAKASLAVGRDPGTVRLIAVSKTQPTPAVRTAVAAGCGVLGENRAQELVAKAPDLADLAPRWVMIGPVQTNKARDVARWADEVQSVDRVELVDALERRCAQAERTLEVMVQVNTSREASKHGVADDAPAVIDLVRAIAERDRLSVRGLMTIGTLGGDEAETRRCFRALASLQARVRDAGIDGVAVDDLSMGMSGDLELAIAEGATTVRVGTALFGPRRLR